MEKTISGNHQWMKTSIKRVVQVIKDLKNSVSEDEQELREPLIPSDGNLQDSNKDDDVYMYSIEPKMIPLDRIRRVPIAEMEDISYRALGRLAWITMSIFSILLIAVYHNSEDLNVYTE